MRNTPGCCLLMTASNRLAAAYLSLTLKPSPFRLSSAFFSHSAASFSSDPAMGRNRGLAAGEKEQRWKSETKSNDQSLVADAEASAAGATRELENLHIHGNRGLVDNVKAEPVDGHFGSSSAVGSSSLALDGSGDLGTSSHPRTSLSPNQFGGARLPAATTQKWVEKPKCFTTDRGFGITEVGRTVTKTDNKQETIDNVNSGLSDIFNSKAPNIRHPLGVDFNVDKNTYSEAKIRATFYPKFENEKSDQEIRTRMIEMVSKGLATLEVTLKHSGSLFMYAGHEGGAYAKNSYGNIYTAVGVFVLGKMFVEAWGPQAARKQKEFREYLEKNRICISMELVTAVLGDHGQRPLEDYVVVTAVTNFGKGKPEFYSTPDLISFCRRWRLPTNHVWLFSSRKSVTSFFAAYDALCEEGTATPVCRALDEVSDVSVPGSKDHVKVQGEILEGLVARIVSHRSMEHMKKVLDECPSPPMDGVGLDMGSSLREICAANRKDEHQQIKALLQSVGPDMCPDYLDWFGHRDIDVQLRNADRSVVSKFLQAHPTDYSTLKLQEMIRLMKLKRFPAAFKCHCNFQKFSSLSKDNLFLRMVIHVHSDFGFRRYQKEMRENPGLWPLYRGFFLDINLFKVNKETASEMSMDTYSLMKSTNGSSESEELQAHGLADEDANLMIKLKFLTYKLRTFLIRNGLPKLFKEGPSAYKDYYLRQMKTWGTTYGKQKELSKMLDEWAIHIRRKQGGKQLSSSIYLSEAEPFLENYARKSPENQALIGSAGNLVKSEDFLAIVEGGHDEEGDLVPENESAPRSTSITTKDVIPKKEGFIVFFPGIPGCAKSALCKEIINAPGGLGEKHPIDSLMGDLIKGKYWQKVADERKKKPSSIFLADKNAPNEEVWRQIEAMCRSTRATAVPVIPDSEGTVSNPFSLEALAVFMFRVLNRVNHPGNLDKDSPNAGYVLLMFYHLYEGKDRREFENDLGERFGAVVKMPLLQPDRDHLPISVQNILQEGLDLYKLHTSSHGRLDSTKGSYAKEWSSWEKRLRETLFANAEYLNAIQVPFDDAVKQVLEQLRAAVKGELRATPGTEKRKFGNIVFAAVTLPVEEMKILLDELAKKNSEAKKFLQEKDVVTSLAKAHVTLAHKRSHGVAAVAGYGVFHNQKVPVVFNALLFSENLAAFEVQIGSIDGEKVSSRNEWPHVTLWAGNGASAKDANMLPQLHLEGKATRVDFYKPATIVGEVNFY